MLNIIEGISRCLLKPAQKSGQFKKQEHISEDIPGENFDGNLD